MIDQKARIEESIQEISGQHEVTSASVPPGVTAASAISLLQEADDTRLGPAVRDLEAQMGVLGSKVLSLVARYYTDTRTIRIGGDEDSFEVFDFKGAMLRDNTRVQVQEGSMFPQSKAAKQAAMQDTMTFLAQTGNPLHGRQLGLFLKDMEQGAAAKLVADSTRSESQINRENQKLLQGVGLPINEYDDDADHLAGHEDFQRSARYDQASPQAKHATETHVEAHRQRIAQQQQQQASIQMQMNGQQGPQAGQQEQQMQQAQAQQQMQQQAAQASQQQQGAAQQQAQQAAGTQQQQDSQAAGSAQQQAAQAAQAHQQLAHKQNAHELELQQKAEKHAQEMAMARRQAEMIAARQSQQKKEPKNNG